MALELPYSANLRIRQCFADAFHVWASNIPVLLGASLTAIALSIFSGTLLMGSLYAGLLLMLLRGIQGEKLYYKQLFSQIKRFIRFFSITIFILLFFFLGIGLFIATGVKYGDEFATEVQAMQPQAAGVHLELLTPGQIFKILKSQGALPLLIGGFLLFIPGLMFVIKSFYMYLVAADRNVRLDEAYVSSRKAVERYGIWKHLWIILLAIGLLILVSQLFDQIAQYGSEEDHDSGLGVIQSIAIVLFQPLGLAFFSSAYNQTLGEEARQFQRYTRQFAEMRDELQTAHDMQMDLLPHENPELESYTLAGTCIPANSVGGDYYAYRWLDKDQTKLAIVVADVSGKAMEAAVTAVRFNEMLRYECHNRTEPAEILDGLNESLEGQIEMATFITCGIAVLDITTHTIKLASGGHCPPVHVGMGNARLINLDGFPLGLPALVRPDEPYTTIELSLAPGDRLVFYSDGVVEAQDAQHNLYDDDRFLHKLESVIPADPSTDLIDNVVIDIKRFIGSAPRTDDITLVMLQRKPASPTPSKSTSA